MFTELRRIAHKSVTELSKGMGQRLGLGRTLVHDPEVLILDEPAAGLDPRARVELRELIALLARDLNKTVLISSHILTELGEICDAAAIIEAGRILASGTVEEIRAARRARPQGGGRRRRLGRGGVGGPHAGRPGGGGALAARTARRDRRRGGRPGGGLHLRRRGRRTGPSLLRNMLAAGFDVTEFAAETESLEDAFMALTEGITQ